MQITDEIAIENKVDTVWDDYKYKVIKAKFSKNAYRLSWYGRCLDKKVLF